VDNTAEGREDWKMKTFNQSFRMSLLLGLILGLQTIGLGQQFGGQTGNAPGPQLKSMDVIRLFIEGRKLSSAEAEKREKALVADPRDLAARISLLAYYSTRHDETFKLKKSEHALWLIRNIPDSEVLHDVVQIRLDPVVDKEFEEAKQLWLRHLDTYKDNLTVVANAADFFMLTDKPLAEKLLKQLAAADSTNPRWPFELGHLYTLKMASATGAMRRSLAASAYPQFELAYTLTNDKIEKHMWLSQLETSAFEAGEVNKAQVWALESLSQGSTNKPDFSLADSTHHGHIILGRIALLSGDLAEARQQLIQAGQTAGSPVLVSFGPNMMLAKELLEKGERDAVIQYFQECANFWKNQSKLDEWTATVKAGRIPNFGANLVY
jgi:hypothetical protein